MASATRQCGSKWMSPLGRRTSVHHGVREEEEALILATGIVCKKLVKAGMGDNIERSKKLTRHAWVSSIVFDDDTFATAHACRLTVYNRYHLLWQTELLMMLLTFHNSI